jgi:putative membrane protein
MGESSSIVWNLDRKKYIFKKIVVLLLAAVLLLVNIRPVYAHDGVVLGGPFAYWVFDPLIIAGLLVTSFLYIRGVGVLSSRPGGVTKTRQIQNWLFAAAIFVLVVALISPVDGLADELFWVHMLQHHLLMVVAAPLMVLSYPLPPMLLALPRGMQRFLGGEWANLPALQGIWRAISSPVVVWVVHALILAIWHIPSLYQASVDNRWFHALQHISFIVVALLFWWVVLHSFATYEKRGMAVLYLFTTMMVTGLLGALITFSPNVIYPIYEERAVQWGLTAMQDQQIAGIIMWVFGGLAYMVGALWMLKTLLDPRPIKREEKV